MSYMDYALDFGTSNTVIARRSAIGSIETVAIVPNLVYVQDARTGLVIVGQEIADQPQRLFRHFKRAIAADIEGFVPEIDGVEVTAKQVGIWFLQNVLKHLKDISRLVLTVPVASFEHYRQWLLEHVACLQAPEIRIIDESTAAALGYGITAGEQTILVIDFGGGTIDFSVVRLRLDVLQSKSAINFLLKWADRLSPSASKSKPTAKVLAKTGENLGGMDIDYWIMDFLNLPKNSITRAIAEKLKISLSTAETASVSSNGMEVSLNRSQLEEILAHHRFYDRLNKCVANLHTQLQRLDLSFANLDAVIVVGGSAQMPAMQSWVKQTFPDLPIHADKPFEAIAHGAISRDWTLQDYLYHSYGLRYWDRRNQCHNWHIIFPEGQTYPTAQPYELILGASVPNQPQIELVIGEIASTDSEVVFAGDQLVVKDLLERVVKAYPLNDSDRGRAIAPLDPLGEVGKDRIKVLLEIDGQRTLLITVIDLLTKKQLLHRQPVIKLQ
jgi:molecular chaperone DnaK (HSP70)